MRIAVDTFPFLLRSAGVKTALYEWVKALKSEGSAHQITCFPFLDLPKTLDHEHSPLPRLQTWLRLAYVHGFNKAPEFARNLLAPRADIFHISIHMRQPPPKIRISTTIHDMTVWLVPETHSAANVRANKEFAEQVYPRASGLLAVSQATKTDACRLLGLDEEKIEVIPNGVAPNYFDVPLSEGERVRATYHLPENFALYLGTIEPRKNVNRMLDAWTALREDEREGWHLILAGPVGWEQQSTIERIRQGDASTRYLGYVPETDLPGLFRAAKFFVYPSLYEGFGLPPAQALAAGVPVLTSGISSLPEVCGPGAIYVDPCSEVDLRRGFARCIGDASLREELARAGREHVSQFTWANAARKSLRFFERITQ
ncbi:MAG: glycosyltransferase family 4 protein [Bryobacterales bacterium]|nr:glycosyltransferase family 4 protein [Bryobacterales bacterium]